VHRTYRARAAAWHRGRQGRPVATPAAVRPMPATTGRIHRVFRYDKRGIDIRNIKCIDDGTCPPTRYRRGSAFLTIPRSSPTHRASGPQATGRTSRWSRDDALRVAFRNATAHDLLVQRPSRRRRICEPQGTSARRSSRFPTVPGWPGRRGRGGPRTSDTGVDRTQRGTVNAWSFGFLDRWRRSTAPR